jgi:hypothetical protein
MERRVEASDLWNLRRKLHDCADGCEIVRLIQWRKRLKFGEVLEHDLCHPHRRGVVETIVDHAMTEGDDRFALEQPASGLNDLTCRGAVVEALRAYNSLLDDVTLSAKKAALVLRRLVNGEFDASGTGVDHRDRIGHGAPLQIRR